MVAEANSVAEIRHADTVWREMPPEKTPLEEKKQHRWLKPLLAAGVVLVVATGGVVLVKQLRKAGQATADKDKEITDKASRLAELIKQIDSAKARTKTKEVANEPEQPFEQANSAKTKNAAKEEANEPEQPFEQDDGAKARTKTKEEANEPEQPFEQDDSAKTRTKTKEEANEPEQPFEQDDSVKPKTEANEGNSSASNHKEPTNKASKTTEPTEPVDSAKTKTEANEGNSSASNHKEPTNKASKTTEPTEPVDSDKTKTETKEEASKQAKSTKPTEPVDSAKTKTETKEEASKPDKSTEPTEPTEPTETTEPVDSAKTKTETKEEASKPEQPFEQADSAKTKTEANESNSSAASQVEDSRVAEEASHRLIQQGKELQAQARQGQKMSEQELEKIYQARRAELEATDLTEQERTQRLEELENTFSIVKNLTEGIPQMQYSAEFTAQMNAIINDTHIADELQQYVQVGNLQEVLWRLEESGLSDEALQLEKIIKRGMVDDNAYHYNQWIIGGNIPTKLKNGIVAYESMILEDLIVYRLDKLFDTKVVPMVVNEGDARTSRHLPFEATLGLHIERALSPGVGNVKTYMQDKENIIFANKYTAYLDFIGMEQVEPPPLTAEHLQRAQLLRYVADSGEANGTYPLRGRALEFDVFYDSGKPKITWDVSQLDFVEHEFIARLQKITLDDFEEVFLAEKYSGDFGSQDERAREAYDRLQTYIQAAKDAAHNP